MISLHEVASHWYTRQGKPMYEVPMTSKSGMRPTDIRDALRLDLVPSVTSIINGVLRKPAIDYWLQQQVIYAALTLPRSGPDETQDAYANRVIIDARQHSKDAAEYGTNVHGMAEYYLTHKQAPEIFTMEEYVVMEGFINWCSAHEVIPIQLEMAFCNQQYNYGGRIDFYGWISCKDWGKQCNCSSPMINQLCVADWKTQGSKEDKPFNIYPDWGVQLAAYGRGIGEPNIPGYSLVISSTEPKRVEGHVWTKLDEYWETFEALKTVYYGPIGQGYRLRNKGVAILDVEQ